MATPPGIGGVDRDDSIGIGSLHISTRDSTRAPPPMKDPPAPPGIGAVEDIPSPPESPKKAASKTDVMSTDRKENLRVFSKVGSQKHFSLPSAHLFKHLRTMSAASVGSLDSVGTPEPSSYVAALEVVKQLLRTSSKSGNCVHVSKDDLQLISKALMDARHHDDIWLLEEAENEVHKIDPDADLDKDKTFDAMFSGFAKTRSRHPKRKKRTKARFPSMAIPEGDKLGPLMRFLDDPNIVLDTVSKIDRWDFDIFALEKKSSGNALTIVGISAVAANNLLDVAPVMTLRECLEEMQKCYVKTPYHNSTHGADVCQGLHALMGAGKGFSKRLSRPMRFGALLAALCHDMGHPGRTNGFLTAASKIGKAPLLRLPLMAQGPGAMSLVTVDTDLASVYNDQSPLENMHMALMTNILRSPSCDVFARLTPTARAGVRKLMIEMVLGTDNTKHAEHMDAIQTYSDSAKTVVEDVSGGTPQACLDILPTLLHAADVSNPVKTWSLSKQWTDAIMTEFFEQGDQERRLGLKVTFDKKAIVLPKFQIFFIRGLVGPFYKALDTLPEFDCSEMLKNLEDNATRWESMLPKKRNSSVDLSASGDIGATTPGGSEEK